jgi:hypothetical protein
VSAKEIVNITVSSDEWVRELGERQKELIGTVMVEDGLMLRDFVDGFMTHPAAIFDGKVFVAMSAVVDEKDGIDKIIGVFKKCTESGHMIFLYMVLKNKGCGTKTIRYAVI